MSIFLRPRSPYWWIRVSRPLGPPIRESTGIPIDGGTPEQTQRNRDLAQRAYRARAGDVARDRYQLPVMAPTG